MPPKDDDIPMNDDSMSGSGHEDSNHSSDEDVAPPQHRPRILEKDSDEEELERFVLGDAANFRENLFKEASAIDQTLSVWGGLGDDGGKEQGSGMEDMADTDFFAIDLGGAGGDKQLTFDPMTQTHQTPSNDVPAWEDSDDERLTISLATATRLRKLRVGEAEDVVNGTEYVKRLRHQYLMLNPLPQWAQEAEGRPAKRRRRSSAASDDSEASDEVANENGDDGEASALPLDRFLRDANAMVSSTSSRTKRLRPEVLDIQRSRDIPDVHKDAVTSLAFHPEHPVLLSSSTSTILHLHHIAPTAHPTPNPLLTSAQVKHVPVRRAEFLYPTGDRIFFAGRRRYIHSWDIATGAVLKTSSIQGHRLEQKSWERFKLSPCGRYIGVIASTRKGGGIVNVLNVETMQWIASARLDSRGGIADFCWWRNGNGLTILGKGGQVGEWSIASRRFLGIWTDEGSNGGTAIALGGRNGPELIGGDRWMAVGQTNGVTNIYDRNSLIDESEAEDELNIKERPEPTRRLMQLTTAATVLRFSPDGQLLAFASGLKADALRLAHLPTCTVYRNWPTAQTPLGRITDVAFGTKSNMLAVGNDVGKIRLWEIRS
ncbi:WD domain, G-beta repeat-containing protein [Camillea tinctor]|nr:WD domain, G-beta repeat-containing protein [Camillea tinctor]